MKSYVTFRRHPLDAVVARTNEDRHPLEVVPYGRFGAGLWTGHPIGLVIVTGLVVIGLIGIPAWRWFFGPQSFLAAWSAILFGAANNENNAHKIRSHGACAD